jgi:putative flippase GtrA
VQESKLYRFLKPVIPRPLRPFVLRYQEILSYMLFGGMTTLVNLLIYFPLNGIMSYLIANVIAWVGSVIFAFLTNKSFVFEDTRWSLRDVLPQGLAFALARLLSLAIEEGILLLFVETLHMNTVVTKIAAQIIVILVNYFASKFFIFRKHHHKP